MSKNDIWNPWHGCHKKSEGCANCYMFYFDSLRNQNSNMVKKNKNDFSLPLKRKKDGSYLIPSGCILRVCLTSDFFLEEADEWRKEAFEIIKKRSDIGFVLVTKRPERVLKCLPSDWNTGYPNVALLVTCENQKRAEERLPILISLPFLQKGIMAEPLLSDLEIEPFLKTNEIHQILCGGENYQNARPNHIEWVKHLSIQAKKYNIPFQFFDPGSSIQINGKQTTFKNSFEKQQFLNRYSFLNHRTCQFKFLLTTKKEIEQLNLFL